MREALDAQALLRPGVLDGVAMVCAGARTDGTGEAVAGACTQLGARVASWQPGEREPNGERLDADVLCYDGGGTFAAHAPGGESKALDSCLADAWAVTRRLVAERLLELHGENGGDARPQDARGAAASEETTQDARRGPTSSQARGYPTRIIFIAPRRTAGAFADAARAALENLARTLSIEWARYGVRAVAIAPGADVADSEVAALVAYIASPAGGYFSGCLFDLTGPAVSLPE